MAVKTLTENLVSAAWTSFKEFLQKSMGKPMIGQTGGEESLKLLNSLVLAIKTNM
jgi:hypothetical protein